MSRIFREYKTSGQRRVHWTGRCWDMRNHLGVWLLVKNICVILFQASPNALWQVLQEKATLLIPDLMYSQLFATLGGSCSWGLRALWPLQLFAHLPAEPWWLHSCCRSLYVQPWAEAFFRHFWQSFFTEGQKKTLKHVSLDHILWLSLSQSCPTPHTLPPTARSTTLPEP